PNGKVDRQALPAPSDPFDTTSKFVAPETERQIAIAHLFAEVLGLEGDRVGLHDNFFEVGGHSLLATQLVSRLRSAFAVELPVQVAFEAPTVAELDAVLETELKSVEVEAIAPFPRDAAPLPLSYAQERLWFLAQLEGQSATYNVPYAVRIEGDLDVDTLQRALDELARRHDILRTAFPTLADGSTSQAIAPLPTVPVEISTLTVPLADWLAREAAKPFDLATEPLLRVKLLHLADGAQVLSVTMHHIISDAWSIGIFFDELATLYRAFRQGKASPLAPLAIQYADYTLWQRQRLQGEVLDSQLDYWTQQLADLPTCLELPSDRPRPPVQTFCGRRYEARLPESLGDRLQAFARDRNVTPFMVLLAAFQVLLYRYSGQPDIAVGTPIANRQHPDLEPLVGFFVNTLVMRARIEDDTTVEDFLSQVRRTALEAYDRQDVPFDRVVEALQPERSLAHSPLFQVMFVMQNAPLASLELAGVRVTPLDVPTHTAKFDLTLEMKESDRGWVGTWEYNSDLFDVDTIVRMATHLEMLLQGMLEDATRSLSTLPLLSESERQRILKDWNDTATDYPRDVCVHHLFEQQVERTPDAIAVEFGEDTLTYRELN
ncbi:MAG: condensation domain-containing protein, partial [Cyanobacteria bacterium J06639_1]